MLHGVTVLELPGTLSVMQAVECFADNDLLILLDSASRRRVRDSRYSFLTADPVCLVRLDRAEFGVDPFQELRRWQKLLPQATEPSLPPFCGGIAGLMSYELGHAFERLPVGGTDEFDTPALLAGLFDWCIVWDHIESTVKACVIALNDCPRAAEGQTGLHAAASVSPADRSQARLDWVMRRLQSDKLPQGPGPDSSRDATSPSTDSEHMAAKQQTQLNAGRSGLRYPLPLDGAVPVQSDFTEADYVATVRRVVEYIRAGDIFQANLSQQLTADWHGTGTDLYRRVRERNAAPFCGLLKAADFSVVSASPERFLRVSRGRFVETRPIKGTRRRQQSPIADLFTSDELTSSEKDRAENVMIVDLLRNDLSRSCRAGSVRVTGLCEIELFETVQHLVSTVVGELRDDCDVWDLCSGCFPGGSITGAPKIRAMQIISELEPVVRGAYCGCLFYLGPQRDFDSSILIRTFTLKNGLLQFPVGGGIVADSDAEDEYRETLHKASGMLRVLTDQISGKQAALPRTE